MLSVRILVCKLLVVMFWGNRKLYVDFLLCKGLVSLTSMLFRGQQYLDEYFFLKIPQVSQGIPTL